MKSNSQVAMILIEALVSLWITQPIRLACLTSVIFLFFPLKKVVFSFRADRQFANWFYIDMENCRAIIYSDI